MSSPNVSLNKPAGVDFDVHAREDNEKLQALGRTVLNSLYMLIRSIRMYDEDNAIFEKPLFQLQDTINAIIKRDAKMEILGIKDSMYLNGMLIKVDMNTLENVRSLLEEMRAKDVGGITIKRSVSIAELKDFIYIFAKEQESLANADGIDERKLVTMTISKWSKLREKLENEKDESEAKLDRKKYAVTCYGRAVFFVRKCLDAIAEGKSINTIRSLRIIQDFIDISFDYRTHFLGMSSIRTDAEYLAYHHANTCIMSIVMGSELGLTKPQLRDLGYIALFHEIGMGALPKELLAKQGNLTPEERRAVDSAPLLGIRGILREKPITRTTLLRLVSTYEQRTAFGTAVHDAHGNVQMVVPKGPIGLSAKIISICSTYDALASKRPYRDAYGPEVALMLMWSELRHKFDPELLRVFMKVMSIPPLKILPANQRTVTLTSI